MKSSRKGVLRSETCVSPAVAHEQCEDEFLPLQANCRHDGWPNVANCYGGGDVMPLQANCRQVGWPNVVNDHGGGDILPLQATCRQVEWPNVAHAHRIDELAEIKFLCRVESNSARPQTLAKQLQDFIEKKQQRYALTLIARQRLLGLQSDFARVGLVSVMKHYDLAPFSMSTTSTGLDGPQKYQIDRAKQFAYSELLRRSRMGLPEFIRLVRGETPHDPRPNKALSIPDHLPCWRTYKYKDEWRDIVTHGVRPSWTTQFPKQKRPPPNHGSALRALNAVIKSLRKGQDDDRYLILDIGLLSSLEGVTCSPFGAVQKGEADITEDARVIHDLSCPKGDSVNDHAQDGTPIEVTYDGAAVLARRVLRVEVHSPGLARMSTGDVTGAFRNVPVAAEAAGRFAGTIPELGILVIDLSCPFGWTDSPRHYWAAGGAIGHLHKNAVPTWPDQPQSGAENFDGKAWCDDHICIEPDIGSRLAEASISLRTSMVSILGPHACNEAKFSPWFVEGKALGLQWNLQTMTLSMPADKILKALQRIGAVQSAQSVSKTQLNKLLGSLRHVATCVRSASPFFQRISSLARNTSRFHPSLIPEEVREDLRWFAAILRVGRLNAVPLSRFVDAKAPDYHIHMDASDRGLCALWPARKEYLQVEFDTEERRLIENCNASVADEFSINIRELMSAVFAAIVWASKWSQSELHDQGHTKFWIDNTSAVAWANRRSSRNPFAQLLLRLIGFLEVHNNFYSSAGHIRGVDNVMADAGSRVWQPEEMARKFADMSFAWTQVTVPPNSRKLSKIWERCSELEL